MPQPPELLSATADLGAERREVALIPTDVGHRLGATLHLPQSAIRDPQSAILLLPGWSGPRTGPAELLVFLAARLAAAGHAVLRIDLHGRGDSAGRFEDGDLDRMIADASAALDFLHARQAGQSAIRNPQSAIIVGGICSGGNVALGLASLRPQSVAGVVALSTLPFQPARDASFERRRRWKNVKQYARKALQPGTWARLLKGEINVGRVKENVAGSERKAEGERNLKDSQRDIERELLAWKGRALFVWGGGDEEAPPARAHFARLHASGCAAQARFETVPGANHNYYGRAWREALLAHVQSFCAEQAADGR